MLGIVGQLFVNLNGLRFDSKGYIVVCNPNQLTVIDPKNKCTRNFDFKKNKNVQTIVCDLRTTTDLWDRFGYPLGKCDDPNRVDICMGGANRGRVVRWFHITGPNQTFTPDEWKFFDLDSMTPGDGDVFPPTKAPTASPTIKAGKGGKGKSGKNKL